MSWRFPRWIAATLMVAGVIANILPAATVQAAAGGLSIGPFLQEVTLSPGQANSSFKITLTNTTTTELPLRISVVDFGAADEAGGINFLPNADDLERRYGLASWMRLEKDALVLTPGTSQQVTVTVENQESLSPGGHYGAVVFEVDAEYRAGEIQPKVNFTKAVSTLVLAKKLGGERQSITLSGSMWSGPPFALPEQVKLRFLNNGNVHTTPKGDVTVTDTFGRVLSKGVVNDESTVILPESLRVYPIKLEKQGTLWLPGWVTVTTRYKANETDKYVVLSTSFFIATPRTVLVAFTILLIASGVIRYRRHGLRHVKIVGTKGVKAVKHVARKAASNHTKRPKRKL